MLPTSMQTPCIQLGRSYMRSRGGPAADHLLPLQVHISYLEIYNETGYDLLDPNREVEMLEDLPKVWSVARKYNVLLVLPGSLLLS